jgi:hypothetical protein
MAAAKQRSSQTFLSWSGELIEQVLVIITYFRDHMRLLALQRCRFLPGPHVLTLNMQTGFLARERVLAFLIGLLVN